MPTTPVNQPTQPTPAPTAPRPAQAPTRPVPPERNPHRWTVPDRACISSAMAVAPDADKQRYRLVADLTQSRMYVVDKESGEPVDAYLISPGTNDHRTPAKTFTIRRVMPMSWWNPPNSDWARNSRPTAPGLDNPMGVLKLDMGQNALYIHGTLQSNYRRLGRPASHGCLRMSNGNVIDLYRNYATVGTTITTTRDRAQSQQLAAQFAASGRTVHSIQDGEEHVNALVNACGPNQ